MNTSTFNMRAESSAFFLSLQDHICSTLEKFEISSRFIVDNWERSDISGGHGGGGITRVLSGGSIFEQAGVNFSEVHGQLPKELSEKLADRTAELPFYATGISIVIHPFSPLVPTTHANLRYLEVAELAWFGGGMDLTPYYLFEEDAQHFHQILCETCGRHNPEYYQNFKQWCDRYFYLPHRGETRGVGGIFFDYLGKGDDSRAGLASIFDFVKDVGFAFSAAYYPIVERRKLLAYSEEQRQFQLLRRGRYVEFNLLYDRGTLFGLRTGGRTESILMSLPPLVRWEYDRNYAPGTIEAKLMEILRSPRDWVSE